MTMQVALAFPSVVWPTQGKGRVMAFVFVLAMASYYEAQENENLTRLLGDTSSEEIFPSCT